MISILKSSQTYSSLSYASATEEDGQASGFDFAFPFGLSKVVLSADTADDYPTSGDGENQ